MQGPEIERLTQAIQRLPGLGPRSARRIVLHLLTKPTTVLEPLLAALSAAGRAARICSRCGNLDAVDPCAICADPTRGNGMLCVVEGVAELWAIERAGAWAGRYHVLGGVLSALGGIGPDELRLDPLVARLALEGIEEVTLALPATVDGQTTAYVVAERLAPSGVAITRLAQGVPLGGALESLDQGTLATALKGRRPL